MEGTQVEGRAWQATGRGGRALPPLGHGVAGCSRIGQPSRAPQRYLGCDTVPDFFSCTHKSPAAFGHFRRCMTYCFQAL